MNCGPWCAGRTVDSTTINPKSGNETMKLLKHPKNPGAKLREYVGRQAIRRLRFFTGRYRLAHEIGNRQIAILQRSNNAIGEFWHNKPPFQGPQCFIGWVLTYIALRL